MHLAITISSSLILTLLFLCWLNMLCIYSSLPLPEARFSLRGFSHSTNKNVKHLKKPRGFNMPLIYIPRKKLTLYTHNNFRRKGFGWTLPHLALPLAATYPTLGEREHFANYISDIIKRDKVLVLLLSIMPQVINENISCLNWTAWVILFITSMS